MKTNAHVALNDNHPLIFGIGKHINT